MTIVDTHCHVGLLKYEPVESLLFHMATSGVDKAVFIQYGGNSDNSYMLECMAAHPGKFMAAMIVEKNDDGTQIRSWAEQGCVGIRLRVNDRAECPDPLAQWRTAAELGIIVSAPCGPSSLQDGALEEVIHTFPELQIVIEHLGGIGSNSKPPFDVFKSILGLAQYPNLSIKLPGFGEICEVPLPFDPIPPLAEMALEAFGPQRMMWGSDYPPVSRREGYQNSLQVPLDYFSSLSENDREWIFGKSALKIWKFAES